ncbi:Gamma-aminobutyric acid receptor subunit beta-2 [Stylophora pistillata]|uniref:Gamma-aminobutyric acid receptor subunit beta-2 n=1 Tax=Stylophora pistillata TaxID=50429 RepID=A0A2B4SRS1_STYPI|nr:Gamma-aminobutyric acid receptor subunit beta-2 [Stylophora pistillata]
MAWFILIVYQAFLLAAASANSTLQVLKKHLTNSRYDRGTHPNDGANYTLILVDLYVESFGKIEEVNMDPKVLSEYVKLIRNLDLKIHSSSTKICGKNFPQGERTRRTQLPSIFPWSKAKSKRRELVKHDVPSKRKRRKPSPTKSVCVELHNVEESTETLRKEIKQQRNPKDMIVPEDIIETDGIEDKTDQVHRSEKEENNVETLKDLKAKLESLEKDLEECKQQLCSANKELDQLKYKVENEPKFELDDYKDNDESISLYTGFPSYATVILCFDTLKAKAENLSYGDGFSTRDVDYRWKRDFITVEQTTMAQFSIVSAKPSRRVGVYISGNYTIVGAFFLLQRRLGYYMIQLYLPCIFLVMLSWIVFWMSPDNGGDRLTVGITCILTIVFLLGYINGMLPKVSYVKGVDWFLMTSFLFIFLSLVECVLVERLANENQKEEIKEEGINNEGLNTSRLSLSKLNPRYRRNSKSLNISSDSVKSPAKGRVHILPVTATAPRNETTPNDETPELSQKNGSFLQCLEGSPRSPRTKCGMKKRTLPEKIDFACRILFPLSYALYNLGYCRAIYFSEPQYGRDVCDRILCPMKSTIRGYCNEGHHVVSAKDMRAALSERPVREARLHKATKNSDGERANGLFACSDPGCNMVFKKFSELESHLDVGGHCQIFRNSVTVYDKLRRDWAEKFLRVNEEEIDSAPVKSSDEPQHQQEAGSPSSDILLGWVLHKLRSQEAVRFTSEVKKYLTTKFDLGERTGTKPAPRKSSCRQENGKKPRWFPRV